MPKKLQKNEIWKTIALWAVVAVGLIGIIWMIATNPKQKQLVCDRSAQASLIGFGSCKEEE